jgi:hypothetical protein
VLGVLDALGPHGPGAPPRAAQVADELLAPEAVHELPDERRAPAVGAPRGALLEPPNALAQERPLEVAWVGGPGPEERATG